MRLENKIILADGTWNIDIIHKTLLEENMLVGVIVVGPEWRVSVRLFEDFSYETEHLAMICKLMSEVKEEIREV